MWATVMVTRPCLSDSMTEGNGLLKYITSQRQVCPMHPVGHA